jgi:hypothetical protein
MRVGVYMKTFDDFAIGDISLDGFQTVMGHYFSHLVEPFLTLRGNNISFNMSAYKALDCVETVQIMVNQASRRILVRPISSSEVDAIRWIKNTEAPHSKPIECASFSRPLFEVWKWNPKSRYRASGKLVKNDKKLMLLFDFSSPEILPAGGRTTRVE